MNYDEILNILKIIYTSIIFRIIIIFLLAIILNNSIKKIVKNLFKNKPEVRYRNDQLIHKNRETANRFVLGILRIMVWVTAILIIFSLLDIDTNAIIAGAGIFGLIIGFGAKNIIESIITGFFMISDGNVSIGDYVRINDTAGIVTDISLRNVTLRTNTGELSIYQVSSIKEIVNYSIDTNHILVHLIISTKYDFNLIFNTINRTITDIGNDIDTESKIYISGFNIYQDNYEVRVACVTVEGTNIFVESIIRQEIVSSLKESGIDMKNIELEKIEE
ncbi:MAG: mechanosensitive ion channel family protein [Haloplasmataceae bacterium]|jgi:small conductance mechanosensitive channel|nr:mechanosensitive ion channel family protein [Haloplasmataceae bacterium]